MGWKLERTARLVEAAEPGRVRDGTFGSGCPRIVLRDWSVRDTRGTGADRLGHMFPARPAHCSGTGARGSSPCHCSRGTHFVPEKPKEKTPGLPRTFGFSPCFRGRLHIGHLIRVLVAHPRATLTAISLRRSSNAPSLERSGLPNSACRSRHLSYGESG